VGREGAEGEEDAVNSGNTVRETPLEAMFGGGVQRP